MAFVFHRSDRLQIYTTIIDGRLNSSMLQNAEA
jgi:hypothetical protein